jgi:hypothetical protein
MFADTDHGFNVVAHSERASLQPWPDRLGEWLADEGWQLPCRGSATPSSWFGY